MNFTREPIIETVITPREGCKLVVRSSKGNSQEDYFVDAVEVVSFGHSFFYRSLERPKAFLVPVSDYEILELKETRMVLKNVSGERSIKIGGGREAPVRSSPRESEESSSPEPSRPQEGRKRERRRRGRRGGGRERSPEASFPHEEGLEEAPSLLPEEAPLEVPSATTEEVKAPSFISKLFPPPPTLIKESLSRYKTAEPSEEALFPQEEEQKTTFEEELLDLSEEQPPADKPDEIEEE